MTQTRRYDFGALLTQAGTKTLAGHLFLPGIYDNMDPVVVSPALLRLTAGAYLLPNGVLVVESTDVDIIPPTPSVATNYTLTADHDDVQAVGGSPATYTWRTGLLPRFGNPNPNSLAILWLRHPGATNIALSMLSEPAKVKTGADFSALESSTGFIQAPFAQACDVVKGANITATPASHVSGQQYLGVNILNSAPSGLQTYQARLIMPAFPWARFLDVYAVLANQAAIGFATGGYNIVAADGTVVGATPSVVNGPLTGLDTPIATIALSSTQAQPVTLGITVTVPPGATGAFIKGFRLRAD